MRPVRITDPHILKTLEEERARIESRYNLPSNSNVNPLSLFKDLDSSVDIPNTPKTNKILRIDKPKGLQDLIDHTNSTVCTNSIIYLPNAVMGWHTNSNMAGNRCYITYSYGDSVFRYQDKSGKIIDSHDIPNTWQLRRFNIPEEGLLWHTISCNGPRISYGFKDGALG